MTLPRPESTALADISGNVFAALIIVLVLIVAALRHQATQIELAQEASRVTRQVLGPEAMIEALARRARAGSGASLEVTRAGVMIARNGTLDVEPLRGAFPAAPLNILVFDHTHYAELAQRLRPLPPQAWVELNVPAALTSPDGGWSEGFRELIGQPLAPARFREALARLLAGGPQGRLHGAPAAVVPSPAFARLPSLQGALTLAAILFAAAFVWHVERRFIAEGA